MKRGHAGSRVHTDEFGAYRGLSGYTHETINHGAAEFVRDDVTTNGIESVFAVLKRGIFRLNEGNVERHTLRRLESFVEGTAGKRLTYKDLIE